MSDNSKLKHDFINNGIRIEVINRLISEALEKEIFPEQTHIKDLSRYLKLQIELAKKLFS